MTEIVNTRTGEISVVSHQERAAVARLTTAITALTEAVDFMPISEVASLKGEMATIQTATKELGMSKEAQELAAEAVRRAEWALGRAIRKGQAEGVVRGGVNDRGREESGRLSAGTAPRPIDFGSRSEIYGVSGERGTSPGVLDLADNAPEGRDFDSALDAARAEGNLSRANVARKARELSSTDTATTAPRRRPLPDVARDAGWDLRKAVERLERIAADDRFAANAEQVTPHLRSHLTYAIEVCQDLVDRFNNN